MVSTTGRCGTGRTPAQSARRRPSAADADGPSPTETAARPTPDARENRHHRIARRAVPTHRPRVAGLRPAPLPMSLAGDFSAKQLLCGTEQRRFAGQVFIERRERGEEPGKLGLPPDAGAFGYRCGSGHNQWPFARAASRTVARARYLCCVDSSSTDACPGVRVSGWPAAKCKIGNEVRRLRFAVQKLLRAGVVLMPDDRPTSFGEP